jgi:hypothetical protein
MVAISLELKTLTPVLTAPTSQREIQVDREPIHFIAKEREGQLYLLTVNARPERQPKVRFTIAGLRGETTARVLFEDRSLRVVNGRLIDEFAGYERHVYEIATVR